MLIVIIWASISHHPKDISRHLLSNGSMILDKNNFKIFFSICPMVVAILDFQWTKILKKLQVLKIQWFIHSCAVKIQSNHYSFWEKLQYLKNWEFKYFIRKSFIVYSMHRNLKVILMFYDKKNRRLKFHGDACIYVYQVVSEIQLALKHSIVCLMKMINSKQLAFYVGKLG